MPCPSWNSCGQRTKVVYSHIVSKSTRRKLRENRRMQCSRHSLCTSRSLQRRCIALMLQPILRISTLTTAVLICEDARPGSQSSLWVSSFGFLDIVIRVIQNCFQSAMLPHAQTLMNLSKHLVSTRPPASPPIPFPGRPLATDFDVLSRRTAPGSLLTDADVADLRELQEDLRAICKRAQDRGVRIIVDAEHRLVLIFKDNNWTL